MLESMEEKQLRYKKIAIGVENVDPKDGFIQMDFTLNSIQMRSDGLLFLTFFDIK